MIWSRSSSSDTKTGAFARVRRFALAGVLATGAALSLPALTTAASAAPTGVCPTDVHNATDCNILITINSNGTVSVTNPDPNNPYDGSDDTLVGIVNNAGASLSSIVLSSSANPPIFGFDGDGICHYAPFTGSSYCTNLPKNTYQGPNNTYSNISGNQKSGTVVFTSPLAGNGASTFFSLESNLSGCDSTDCVSVPPGTLTISKTDNTGKPLVGGSYSVYSDATPHGASTLVGSCTISALDQSGNATCTDKSLSSLKAGVYYVDETNPPVGFTAATETKVLVFGNTTATIVDDPAPVTVIITKTGTGGGALDGATFTLESGTTLAPVSSSVASPNNCTTSGTPATCSITVKVPGSYALVETGVPTGYTAAANTSVTVDPTKGTTVAVIITDTAAPATAVASSPAPAAPVAGATTVHTGESFAGSAPYVAATLALGGSLLGLGLVRRRHVRRPTA